MTRPQILIVEDEINIRRFVRIALEQEGFTVREAETAAMARRLASSRAPDMIILDLNLPDGDGQNLIREWRAWCTAPILVLSARDSEAEKVEALNHGADDYLVKPFAIAELLARVRANLRRASLLADRVSPLVRFGPVTVDLAQRRVSKSGEPVHLTPNEFRLLAVLIRNHGKVVTHRQLLLEVWGPGYAERPHYIRVYMAQLRQKLEEDPSNPLYLTTELQVGYRLTGLERAPAPPEAAPLQADPSQADAPQADPPPAGLPPA